MAVAFAHETPGLIALSFNPCGGPFGLRRIAPATTPSADFRLAVGTPRGGLSPRGQPRRLMVRTSRDFLPARPAKPASYPISVRRVAISPRASYRPRLAATPLRFTRASPPSDFHTQDAGHARHTGCEPFGGARGPRTLTGAARSSKIPAAGCQSKSGIHRRLKSKYLQVIGLGG
jgi:hypothetical protein